jgi:HJR/Mrr/RecB family endonuclease
MVFLLLYPSDAAASKTAERLKAEQSGLRSKTPGIAARHQELKSLWQTESDKLKSERLAFEREQLAASHEHRRKLLLAENWKAMRAVEFEAFLERVFTELGYKVETTKVTGDQGVDLVVSHRDKRIAIQVKGYVNSVSNGAVQEAHTGMSHYKCDAAAVITNSRFTPSAIELATSVRCQLVDEDLLPKMILGTVDLWSMCFEGGI